MNVLFLDQFSELGGAQRCLLDLLPALQQAGWRAQVAAPGTGGLLKRSVALGATAETIHCGPYSSGRKTLLDLARFAVDTPRLAGEIRTLVRRYAPDLVYVNGPRVLPGVALATRNGPPVLFHSHSRLDGYTLRIAGWSLETACASVAAACDFVAWPLVRYCGARGVRVIYNGVRAASCPHVSDGAPNRGPRIGVIGRISPEKGQADFLRAARLVHQDLPGCQFVICGAPLFASQEAMRYRTELDTLAHDLPVEFTGWQEDVESVLAKLDLLVVPSTAVDATPRIILEAFAAGVPVMAFACGGIPEIVEHNVTGFLVEQRSAEALAKAMRHLLLCEQDRMREVAERARSKALSDFSLERYQAQMIEAMKAALKV